MKDYSQSEKQVSIGDGGRAFPRTVVATYAGAGYKETSEIAGDGMTLRDYFAAKALQGMMANPRTVTEDGKFSRSNFKAAYEMADAMLKARGVK